MILLFKKTKLFAFVTIPLWIVGVVLARFAFFPDGGVIYPVLIALCGAYVLYTFAVIQANKMHRSFNDILSDECDPDRFIELYTPLREEGLKHKGTLFITESAYATALHLAGRSAEAREIVRSLMARPNFARQRVIDRGDAFIDEGIYSLAVGDLPAARDAIERADALLDQLTVGSADYNRLFREVTRLRYRADIAEGIYDEALEYFTDTSREYTVPYTKVNRMNTLAQIYRGKGDLRLLRKCLSYIAENGGTLKMAKDAREELGTLPEVFEEPVHEDEDGD